MGVKGLIYSSIIKTNVLMQEYLKFNMGKRIDELSIFYNIHLRSNKYIIYKSKYDIIPKRKKIKFKEVANLDLITHINSDKCCKLVRHRSGECDVFRNMPYALCFSEIV